MSSQTIEQPRVVSRDEWLKERVALLAREKQLTRDREELARQRRRLPWIRLDKEYVFEGYEGAVSLGELFNGRSQLIVYHFMFTPGWEYGCRSCSLMADHFDGSLPHLAARDVTLAAVSRAPFTDFDPFRQRMGWGFEWVSSHSSEFSYDYGVAFNPELIRSGAASYNFEPIPTDARLPLDDLPGLSVFHRGADGEIFHTYSAYARGLEPLIGVYNWLDLVPKGRDEEGLAFPMAWLRHHDDYADYVLDPTAGYQVPPTRHSCCGPTA